MRLAVPPRLERLAAACARPGPRAALVLGLAFALMVGTGARGRNLSGDPATYACVSREIVLRGDPTRLTLYGKPYVNKPPLVLWMEAAAFEVLGTTEAAARLPSRLFGIATIALLMGVVAAAHGRRAAFWAGLVGATWHVFLRTASQGRLDTTLAFFTLAAVGTFLRISRRGFTVGRALGLGACVGLSILAKGPAGALALGGVGLGALATGRGRLALKTAPWALLATVLVAGHWYGLQLAREGTAYFRGLRADLGREDSPFSSFGPAVVMYADGVFLRALPWALALFPAAALAVRRVRRHARRALLPGICLATIAVLLAGVLTRGVHYARYFAPVVPYFAALVGPWLAVLARRRGRRPLTFAAAVLAGLVCVGYPLAVAAGAFDSADRYAEIEDAVRVLDELAPGASDLPTWSARQEASADLDDAGALGGSRAGTLFYFGKHLVRWRANDPTQPPVVLFRHLDGPRAAADRAAFEARYTVTPMLKGREFSVYRTR